MLFYVHNRDMLHFLRKIDLFLDRHVPYLSLITLLTLLRLPNFTEPYWYGDEGIYLTLGIALRQGEKLYSQIIDHKTPLIYYLAMVPNQFWFRVLNLAVMILATSCFYWLAKKIFVHQKATFISTLVFILLTTLPMFEGNIPNGELFVIFFVMIGATLLAGTSYFQVLIQEQIKKTKNQHIAMFVAGVCFGLGILTKVPALFDLLAFLSIAWFSLTRTVLFNKKPTQSLFQSIGIFAQHIGLVIGGTLLPIIASIIYFIARGSGKAYLDYGLLYNFRYAGSWVLNFNNPALSFLFTLPGKALLLGGWLVILTLIGRKISARFQFLASWLGLSFFAALLSNRPYPHYFMQVFPSLSLIVGYFIASAGDKLKNSIAKKRSALYGNIVIESALSLAMVFVMGAVILLLNFKPYPTVSYYIRFGELLTGKITWEQYRNSFDKLMADNYAAAKIIVSNADKHLFIWGTDPMLYALTQKSPVGRFTVLFHIRDFHVEHETYLDFVRTKPAYAVVMQNEEVPQEISSYLEENYMPNTSFERFVLWKKIGQ
jgi:hypothetical protein